MTTLAWIAGGLVADLGLAIAVGKLLARRGRDQLGPVGGDA